MDAGLERLKVIYYVAGKKNRGRDFQSLEFIGINEFTNSLEINVF